MANYEENTANNNNDIFANKNYELKFPFSIKPFDPITNAGLIRDFTGNRKCISSALTFSTAFTNRFRNRFLIRVTQLLLSNEMWINASERKCLQETAIADSVNRNVFRCSTEISLSIISTFFVVFFLCSWITTSEIAKSTRWPHKKKNRRRRSGNLSSRPKWKRNFVLISFDVSLPIRLPLCLLLTKVYSIVPLT